MAFLTPASTNQSSSTNEDSADAWGLLVVRRPFEPPRWPSAIRRCGSNSRCSGPPLLQPSASVVMSRPGSGSISKRFAFARQCDPGLAVSTIRPQPDPRRRSALAGCQQPPQYSMIHERKRMHQEGVRDQDRDGPPHPDNRLDADSPTNLITIEIADQFPDRENRQTVNRHRKVDAQWGVPVKRVA
jgi:hypothetical protein